MQLAPKRRLAIGVSVLAVALVGAGASSACDGGVTHAQTARFTAFHTEHHHVGWWRMGLQTTAAYLGVTPQQLVADLKAGRSPAQIAPAGKTAAGLADAWLAAAKAKLDAAVAGGKLTSTQESDWLAKLGPKLTAWANAIWTKSWTGDRDADHFGGLWHR